MYVYIRAFFIFTILIDKQLSFYSTMRRKNDVSDIIGCLQVVRIYIFMNEIKLYISTSYLYYFSLLSY